jgi:hypothetical protein
MQWRLIFSGLQSIGWPLLVIVAVLAALALCVSLMRLERRLISRQVGWILLGVRCTVLAWLLFVMFQPVITSEWDVSETGRVVVAIDTSQSMETADKHAGVEEKLRWALALGMLDSSLTDAQIQELAQVIGGAVLRPAIDAGLVESPISAARVRQTQEVLDEFDRMPRQEFVKRLLTSGQSPFLDALSEVAALDLRLFATDQQQVQVEMIPDSSDALTATLGPTATDAVGLLSELTSEQDGNRIRGVVMLSDGRQTEPGDLLNEGRRLGNLQVPVYAVPVGSRLKPRDISIASIEAPEAVFVDDAAMLNVVLGTSGFEGTPITVELEKDGILVASQTVTPAADSARVSFTAPTMVTGRFEYRVRVAEQVGELRADNNERSLSFQVVDNKGRVLLVDGDARWELRYLKNLLERDKQVDLTSVVFRQPYLQLLNDTFIERSLPAGETLREQLAETDLLIVGDVIAGQVTDETWKQIEDAVSRDGLTVVLIPGRRGLPDIERWPTLQALLPVENPAPRLAEQYQRSAGDGTQSVFHLQSSDDADLLPMFQFADAANPSATLRTLPGHPWVCTGEAKASATVWAWALNPANPVEREPVIIHQYFGFGQVIWMGVDSTWRWRQRRGDALHHKFWGQLVRWAARNRTASGNDQVRLTLSDVVVEEHESTDVVARFSPRGMAELGDAAVEVVVTPADTRDADEPVQPIRAQLEPSAESPRRFAGRIPPLPSGTWNVSLAVAGHEKLAEGVTSELVVQPHKSPELADVSCHHDALQQLSEASGGQLVEPWQLETLLEVLKPEEYVEARLSEHTLWDHWSTLLVFFALLTTEWVTRKLNGLP